MTWEEKFMYDLETQDMKKELFKSWQSWRKWCEEEKKIHKINNRDFYKMNYVVIID